MPKSVQWHLQITHNGVLRFDKLILRCVIQEPAA